MNIMLRRTVTGFEPADTFSASDMQRIKVGKVVECTLVEKRNGDFHRKVLGLIRVGFQQWNDNLPYLEYEGVQIKPCFEQYREDVIIAAGYYEPVFDIGGNLKLKARTISYAGMSQDEFEKLYSSVMDVILARLNNYTKADLQEQVDLVLGFL